MWRAALLYVGLAAVLPTDVDSLRSHPRPTHEFEAAVELAGRMQLGDTAAEAAGKSILLVHGRRTPRAVVLFHGITNSPLQFRRLAEQLYQDGDNVFVPRLPEHALRGGSVRNLARLTARALRDVADESIDVATGLGDTVVVLGLSLGGDMAAWTAQFRPEVNRAVVVAPALALSRLPSVTATPVMNLALRVPNVSNGDPPDTLRPDRTLGWSSHGVAEMFLLGSAVRRAAGGHAPAVLDIRLLVNAHDRTVSRAAIDDLAGQWSSFGAHLSMFEFPDSLRLPHDVVDPDQRAGRVDVTHPVLFALIHGTAPPARFAVPVIVADTIR